MGGQLPPVSAGYGPAAMQLRIDADRCTGHGRCYSLAPDLFEPDDEGNGVVVGDGVVPPGQEDVARRAATNCPERAVIVVD
jgi:ferredoxin